MYTPCTVWFFSNRKCQVKKNMETSIKVSWRPRVSMSVLSFANLKYHQNYGCIYPRKLKIRISPELLPVMIDWTMMGNQHQKCKLSHHQDPLELCPVNWQSQICSSWYRKHCTSRASFKICNMFVSNSNRSHIISKRNMSYTNMLMLKDMKSSHLIYPIYPNVWLRYYISSRTRMVSCSLFVYCVQSLLLELLSTTSQGLTIFFGTNTIYVWHVAATLVLQRLLTLTRSYLGS